MGWVGFNALKAGEQALGMALKQIREQM
ncbi:hypothetical protein EMIT043CA1_190089 [Pseudomonas brassicacearum]